MQENEKTQENQEGAWMQEDSGNADGSQDFQKREKFRIVIEGKELAVTKEFQFLNEGKKIKSDYGEAIVFLVLDKFDEQEKDYFVNTKKWSLLKEIKANAPLTGKTVKITRVGKTKTDTRYSMVFLKPQEVAVKKEVVQ
jgi:hypothetical protein